MSWTLNSEEYSSVLSLPGPQRYEYFVRRVADWGVVWSLGSETGWATSADDSGNIVIPFWPHETFALGCARRHWINFTAKSIALEEFLDRWIPGMTRDSRLAAIFPTPAGQGVPVAASRIAEDLREALEMFE